MFSELLILVLGLLSLFFLYVKHKYSFWSNRNVPFPKPQFPFGNFQNAKTKSMASTVYAQYSQMKNQGSFYGLYFFMQPLVVITDLELIKAVLIKDFDYFPNRGMYHNPRDDPLSGHLVAIEGNKWRSLRTRLTPTFTSGRLKVMFPTLKEVGDNFSEYLKDCIGDTGKELEVKDCVARFTIDVIGSCAFGIECNSFTDPDSRFRKFGKQIFDNPRHSQLVSLFLMVLPEVGRALRMKSFDDEASEFFYKLVEDTVRFREQNTSDRNDFMKLLLELKNGGVPLSMDEIAAQSFIFFIAGFETSSGNQMYCLYQLAKHQEYQEKARQCVINAIRKHGSLTYEAAMDMQYLDQCINETLRMYPSFPTLGRRAVMDYKIPNSHVVIPKGMKVQIPTYAIHRDEQYYPDPDRFDPDRFTPEAVAKRNSCAFLPFGEGPRHCIGMRFGMMQSRVGLAAVLSRFSVSTCAKTASLLEYAVNSATIQPKEGLWLKFEPLCNENSKRTS